MKNENEQLMRNLYFFGKTGLKLRIPDINIKTYFNLSEVFYIRNLDFDKIVLTRLSLVNFGLILI